NCNDLFLEERQPTTQENCTLHSLVILFMRVCYFRIVNIHWKCSSLQFLRRFWVWLPDWVFYREYYYQHLFISIPKATGLSIFFFRFLSFPLRPSCPYHLLFDC